MSTRLALHIAALVGNRVSDVSFYCNILQGMRQGMRLVMQLSHEFYHYRDGYRDGYNKHQTLKQIKTGHASICKRKGMEDSPNYNINALLFCHDVLCALCALVYKPQIQIYCIDALPQLAYASHVVDFQPHQPVRVTTIL